MLEYCVLEGKKDISFTKAIKNVLMKEYQPH